MSRHLVDQLIAPRAVRSASPCHSRVVLDVCRPNPSHIDQSRVVMLAVDTGPPPDTVLIKCDGNRHWKKRNKWRRKYEY